MLGLRAHRPTQIVHDIINVDPLMFQRRACSVSGTPGRVERGHGHQALRMILVRIVRTDVHVIVCLCACVSVRLCRCASICLFSCLRVCLYGLWGSMAIMYACVHACMCGSMSCMYACMCACMVWIHVFMYSCAHAPMHSGIDEFVWLCVHVFVPACLFVLVLYMRPCKVCSP